MANFHDVLNHIYVAQALKMDTDLQCSFLLRDSSKHTKCFDLCTIVAYFLTVTTPIVTLSRSLKTLILTKDALLLKTSCLISALYDYRFHVTGAMSSFLLDSISSRSSSVCFLSTSNVISSYLYKLLPHTLVHIYRLSLLRAIPGFTCPWFYVSIHYRRTCGYCQEATQKLCHRHLRVWDQASSSSHRSGRGFPLQHSHQHSASCHIDSRG
jgi:hypothetical protein